MYIVRATPNDGSDKNNSANIKSYEENIAKMVDRLKHDGLIVDVSQVEYVVATNEKTMLIYAKAASLDNAMLLVASHGNTTTGERWMWGIAQGGTPERWRERWNVMIANETNSPEFSYLDEYSCKFFGCNPIDGRELPSGVVENQMEPILRGYFR